MMLSVPCPTRAPLLFVALCLSRGHAFYAVRRRRRPPTLCVMVALSAYANASSSGIRRIRACSASSLIMRVRYSCWRSARARRTSFGGASLLIPRSKAGAVLIERSWRLWGLHHRSHALPCSGSPSRSLPPGHKSDERHHEASGKEHASAEQCVD